MGYFIDNLSVNLLLTSFQCTIYTLLGMVSTWYVDGRGKPAAQSSSYGSNGRSSITVIKWNSNGRRLITGDEVRYITLNFSEVVT